MPDFHDNLLVVGPSPALDLRESDQALPAGLWRMRLEGNAWSIVRNTAVAGDYSSSQSPVVIDGSGAVSLNGGPPIVAALSGYLKANGAAPCTASPTIPAADVDAPGANSQVVFNFAGDLAADPDLTWDPSTNTLTLNGSDTEIIIRSRAAEPAAPGAGTLGLYAKAYAGRDFVEAIDASGIARPLQGTLWGRRVEWIMPSNATALTSIGVTGTTQGTVSHPALVTTNRKTATRRARLTSGATAGAIASYIAAAATWYRGIGAGIGGYFAHYVITLETLQAGNRGFFGMQDSVAAPTNIDPLTNSTPGRVGIGFNSNTGNWRLINNVTGTPPTVLDLGASFPINATDIICLTLVTAPNASGIQYEVTNLTNGAKASGSLASNIPNATTFLATVGWMTNNATAAAVAWAFMSLFVEDRI